MVHAPPHEFGDDLEQGLAQLGQGVLDARRYFGVNPAADQPVAFEVAQCNGEHALADPVDLAP
jgi:hypothetical protein